MNTKQLRLLFYDFEIFQYDWMVVIIDYNTRRKKIIVNNRDELIKFYELAKDNYIWIGYNSRNYDSVILKGIILGMNPKELNDKLIIDGLKPFQISKEFNKIQLYSYDTMVNRGESLKQLEGMMGHMIKESDVDFNINRKLTRDEINETIYYCTHDVEETIEVFENTKSDFDAVFGLINLFNLPLTYITKTKAQLTATILGAKKMSTPSSPEDYQFVDCLKLDRYNWIKDWYDKNRSDKIINEKGKEVTKGLTTDIFGLKHQLGIGGLHSAIPKYYTDNSDGSIIVHQDIASYYPNMMVNHGLLSRAVEEPDRFKKMLEQRLQYKAEGNPLNKCLKISINACYGVTNDQFNPMYDPQRSREITINCQLLLVDLIEKIETQLGSELCTYIQGNTDGLIFKLKNKEAYDKLIEISSEWEDRTGFKFEYDEISKIAQKDVNNYVFEFTNGKLECKGSYLQFNKPLKNDMSILNDALREYLIHGTPVEDTINNCNDLIKFQHINKIGGSYYKVMWGDKELKEKVIRTFACKKDLPGLFKVKKVINKDGEEVDSIQKVANNSEHIFIDNGDITDKKCPEYLDKQWYIDEANKRVKAFGVNIND